MSLSAVYDFINRSETDTDLQARLRETRGSEAIVSLAAECGYDFAPDELEPVVSMLTFVRALWEDAALRDAVARAEDDEAVTRIAAQYGYTFPAEALAHISLSAGGELSEEELSGVAGGTITSTTTRSMTVSVDSEVEGRTAETDFASILQKSFADTTISGVSLAAPFVPGGAVISAAISG